jgi:predicted peptidase
MRFSSLWLSSALCAGIVTCPLYGQDVKPDPNQQVRSFRRPITRTLSADYLLFLPRSYAEAADQQWPLILFLHGAGERGTNVWLVAKHGPPKLVRTKPEFPFIVASPQCPAGQTWSNDTVLALLDELLARYRVDPARVYLTGLSMGGYGTWSLALAAPERFAAVVPICGGGDPIKVLLADPRQAAALKSLPVWAFHGAKDPVVKLIESERMVNALKQSGSREVQLTVYPEAGHDSWTEAYDNPQLYDWLLARKRELAARPQ